MTRNADRLWVRELGAGWAQCVERLENMDFSEPEVNLVSIQEEPGADDRSWSRWP